MIRRDGRDTRSALKGALLVGLTLALTACGSGSEASEAQTRGRGGPPGGPQGGSRGESARAAPVSARVAEAGNLEVTLRASTNLRARERIDLVPKQAGVVVDILVEEGDRVEEGQVLARLDAAEWQLQAEQAEARAAAATEAANRARRLQEMDLVSEQEVERLVSEARVAEADLGLARLRVENASMRAPFTGTVTHRNVDRGQQVNTSEPAFSLAALDRLEAVVSIPEREIGRVAVGQTVRILLQEGAAPVTSGVVERIRPVVDATSGTVQVTVTVPAASTGVRLRPGQFVNVDLVTETLADRITLPRTSVLVDGAAPRVFLVRGGEAEEREVELGYSRGDRVEIRSGVEPGDTVVVVGQDNLREGAAVRIMQMGEGDLLDLLDGDEPGAGAPAPERGQPTDDDQGTTR
ncbi:MAG: efflux RND transporter periplasmic adaptor subunit [Gemmatimonadota bacterium]|nr:efflux RND transporter periplasmic adaptor subunit [Gemmatimonadota bacterium]